MVMIYTGGEGSYHPWYLQYRMRGIVSDILNANKTITLNKVLKRSSRRDLRSIKRDLYMRECGEGRIKGNSRVVQNIDLGRPFFFLGGDDHRSC